MNCFLSVTSEGPGGRRGTELPDCLFTFALFKWSLSSQHLLHITTQISVLMTAIMPALTHTCSNISTGTHAACNITIIHRSSGTLYPLQTTLHNKWTFSHCWPFCLLRAFHFSSQFGVVWWMQMGTYLIGSVPKMEINGALPFFFFFSPLPKLFWAVLSSAVCGENVNKEGRGCSAAAAGLIQNSVQLQTGPQLPHNEGRKLHGPHVPRCLTANLVKCLLVMQLANRPITRHRAGCSGFGTCR